MRKILFLLSVFAFSAIPAFSQGVIEQILKRMDAHQKSLKSLQADMMMTRFSVQFGGTYTKEGTLNFLTQPQKDEYWLAIDSVKPTSENFLIVKNEYLIYSPNLKIAYTGKTTDSQKNILMIFSNLSKKNLKADYLIKYIGQEKVNNEIFTWKLEITPKQLKIFKTLELWIDKDGMAIQSKATENNGDWTNVMMSNIQKNAVIHAKVFTIKLPKDTKIIKN